MPSGGRPSRCHAMLGRAETNSLTESPAPPTHRGQCSTVNRSARRAMHSSQRGQVKNTVPLPRGSGSSARATITLPAAAPSASSPASAHRSPNPGRHAPGPPDTRADHRGGPTRTARRATQPRLGFNHALALQIQSRRTAPRPLTEARVTRSKTSIGASARTPTPTRTLPRHARRHIRSSPGLIEFLAARPRIVGGARGVERPDRRPAGAGHALPPARGNCAAGRARSSPREQERGLGWPIDRARRWFSGP